MEGVSTTWRGTQRDVETPWKGDFSQGPCWLTAGRMDVMLQRWQQSKNTVALQMWIIQRGEEKRQRTSRHMDGWMEDKNSTEKEQSQEGGERKLTKPRLINRNPTAGRQKIKIKSGICTLHTAEKNTDNKTEIFLLSNIFWASISSDCISNISPSDTQTLKISSSSSSSSVSFIQSRQAPCCRSLTFKFHLFVHLGEQLQSFYIYCVSSQRPRRPWKPKLLIT